MPPADDDDLELEAIRDRIDAANLARILEGDNAGADLFHLEAAGIGPQLDRRLGLPPLEYTDVEALLDRQRERQAAIDDACRAMALAFRPLVDVLAQVWASIEPLFSSPTWASLLELADTDAAKLERRHHAHYARHAGRPRSRRRRGRR